MRRAATGMAWAVLGLTVAGCGPPRPWTVSKGRTYEAHGTSGAFDLYRPHKMRSAAPLIVAIHGGAWRGGSRAWGDTVANTLCVEGYAVAAIDYRLAPAHRWPAQLDDCLAAVAYMRSAGPAMGIDPTRIGTLGVSAGGHLASMTALRDPAVRCAVSSAGEGDLRGYLTGVPIMADEGSILRDLFGGEPTAEQLADASPAAHARPGVSIMLVHALDDSNVYYAQSEALHRALLLVNADVGFRPVPGNNHSRAWADNGAVSDVRGFLRARLDPRAPHRSVRGKAAEFWMEGEELLGVR